MAATVSGISFFHSYIQWKIQELLYIDEKPPTQTTPCVPWVEWGHRLLPKPKSSSRSRQTITSQLVWTTQASVSLPYGYGHLVERKIWGSFTREAGGEWLHHDEVRDTAKG